jgi:hypothetical protein
MGWDTVLGGIHDALASDQGALRKRSRSLN